ncbi:MAG: Do family serine endopeptidase [Ignavibacteriaceae bacterium]|nr:Do family serine endopeptidase [Ignavibacteriaceae bacterium]
MKKKTVIASALFSLFILAFAAIIVASFSGSNLIVADSKIDFNTTPPIPNPNPSVLALNEAFMEVANKVTPTIVYIEVTNGDQGKNKQSPDGQNPFEFFFGPDFDFGEQMPMRGSGSGVIISSDGYIITNNHVVENASDAGIKVTLTDKREFHAKLVGTDPTTDIAVIKIDATDLPVASVGNSDNVHVGQWVIAIGNPLGLNYTVTTGIVSALGRNLPVNDNRYAIANFIQTDAAINPGNSGGALVDVYGSVIGINSAIKSNTGYFTGYGFAIPMNIAKSVASDLIATGKVSRGYIGISIKDVDGKEARGLGLERTRGVLIQEVQENGAGYEAGLKTGDVILKVDGNEVNASNQLQTIISQKSPGDKVELEIFRNGSTMNFNVTLKPRADVEERLISENQPRNQDTELNSKSIESIGLEVSDMTGSMRKSFDISNGILVKDVKNFSESFERGLRPGMVILEAEKEKLDNVEDFMSVINSKNKGDVIILKVMDSNKNIRIVAVEI